jgi:hydroxyacylglutathione hydrolase
MALEIVTFELGPLQTNTYLIADSAKREAAVIDPAWDGERIVDEAETRGWAIGSIWLTHAHFDHTGGIAGVAKQNPAPLPVALHPADLPLWESSGGAKLFGFRAFDPGPRPTISLEHGMMLTLGERALEVRHTPGHSPGHVAFLDREEKVFFVGDLIFRDGVGRTDLSGGDWDKLFESIRQEVLILPDDVQLLPGHGPASTVGRERRMNPFLGGGY